MSRMPGSLLVGVVATLVVPTLMGTSADLSAVVLAALVVTLAASVRLGHVPNGMAVGPTPSARLSGGELVVVDGRVTDPVHHPIRPRAPGMV